MFSNKPWDTLEWNKVQQDANTCLEETEVRDENILDQENMMKENQKNDMMEYYRPGGYLGAEIVEEGKNNRPV